MCVILIAAMGGANIQAIQDANDDSDVGAVILPADVNFIDRYKAGFGDSGLPPTLAWVLAALNSVWATFIIIGWVRGQH